MLMKHERLYMLRLWLEGEGGEGVWRASLKDVKTKDVKYFGTLESFVKFVRGHEGKGLLGVGSPEKENLLENVVATKSVRQQ